MAESLEILDWAGSARVAAPTNTLTALTLAGVLVTNTYIEEVAQKSPEGRDRYYCFNRS